MSALEEYRLMTALKHERAYLRQHTTHHADCGCLTKAADDAISELLGENEALTNERDELKYGTVPELEKENALLLDKVLRLTNNLAAESQSGMDYADHCTELEQRVRECMHVVEELFILLCDSKAMEPSSPGAKLIWEHLWDKARFMEKK